MSASILKFIIYIPTNLQSTEKLQVPSFDQTNVQSPNPVELTEKKIAKQVGAEFYAI